MIIQADLHTHTVASTHAYSTVTENCAQAERIGVKCIAMTDHAMKMPDSPHIWHFGNLGVIPRKICGVTVLKGAEANIIDYEGGLDLVDGDPYKLEFIVASFHRYYFGDFSIPSPKTVTDGYIKALSDPRVDMIGHPTAIKFPVQWERLVPAAKEAGVLLELNESSIKTGKSPAAAVAEMLYTCKKYSCPISVDTDAHFWNAIGATPQCQKALSETDFPVDLVANADWDSLREKISAKRPGIDI